MVNYEVTMSTLLENKFYSETQKQTPHGITKENRFAKLFKTKIFQEAFKVDLNEKENYNQY